MGQHGVSIAAIAGNRLGNRREFSNTASGKRLHTSRFCDQLVNRHVQSSEEIRVKLLRKDVVRHSHSCVLLFYLFVVLRSGQNLINHVVEHVQHFHRDIHRIQFCFKSSNILRGNLRSTR